jgi:ribosomal protein L11 methyltransferase
MVELVLRVQQAWVEPVSDALADELGALSVSIEDADAHTPAEQAIFGEPGMPSPRAAWALSTLRTLFDDEPTATEAVTLLLAQDDVAAAVQVQSLAPVPDADWVRLTQAQFAPVAVTPDFWIVPSWHDVPPAARTALRLDPGLAFGTGTHPTTRMCLRWIAHHAQAWPRVLDYGCGSGILAIASALHGALDVDAVDIDPAAVDASAANARSNGVPQVRAAAVHAAAGRYDLVLANILARPLTLLAPLLCAHAAPGGYLVLAGILERQAGELTAAYAPWCDLRVTDGDDGWVLMTAAIDRSPGALR